MDHSIEEVELTDALKGIFIHVPNAPVIDFEMNFRSGYQFVPREKYDVPHLLEHLISGENERYPGRKALRREMDRHGAYHNASTNFYYNRYIFEAPLFDAQRLLDVQLAALTTAPAFSDEEFKREKSVVGDELSGRLNDYDRELSILLDRAMGMQVLDYANRFEKLQSITLKDIKQFYKSSHTQRNSRFIVAGDLSEHRTYFEEKLRSELIKLPEGEYWDFEQEKDQNPKDPVHLKRDVQTTVYKIRFAAEGHTKYRDGIIMNLMKLMLTDMWNSMIFGEGRDKGVLYAIASGASRGIEYSTFGFSGSVQNVNIYEIMQFIGEKLRQLKNGEFNDALLEEAKQFRKGQFVRSYQTSRDVLGWYYSSYSFDDEINHLDTYLPTIESVTTEDIKKLAGAFFKDDIWGFGLLTNQDSKTLDAHELQETLRKGFTS